MAGAARKKERAPFNRDVLKWARERVRLSYDGAAKGAGVTANHIQNWEAGSVVPTIKQARRLAGVYDLPFMELLSKERPKVKDLELVPDFRMQRETEQPTEQYDLILIQSEAEEVRLNAIDLLRWSGVNLPHFQKLFTQTQNKKQT